MPTALPSQPTENQNPWYTTMKAWMDGVALNISELNADRLTHVDAGGGVLKPVTSHLPTGGTTGQILAKSSNSDYAVGWVTSSGSVSPPVTWTGTDAAQSVLTMTGASGQTANVLNTYINGNANPVLAVTSTGEVRCGPGTHNINGTLKASNTDVARKGIVFNAVSGQTANLLELQVNNSVVMSVNSVGTVTAPNIGAKVIVLNAADAVPAGTPSGTVILRRP